MNFWLKIVLTDVVVVLFGIFLEQAYKVDKHPIAHTIFQDIVAIGILVLPVFLITFIWTL